MPSTSWRAAMARSGRIQLIGPRKSLMITAIPRRRSGRRSASIATARSPRTPTGALGHGRDGPQQRLLVHAGRTAPAPELSFSPLAISAPSRFPPPLLRNVMAAAAATARSRFSQTGGAEVQAGRHVDHQPGLQFAVGDHLPDVR